MKTRIMTNYHYDWDSNEKNFFVYQDDICFHYDQQHQTLVLALPFENEIFVLEIFSLDNLVIDVYHSLPLRQEQQDNILNYVIELLDLNYDLPGFYLFSAQDPILKLIYQDHIGLRAYSYLNLYEAFMWTIIGQQINMKFAYSIKTELVKKYGREIKHKDLTLFVFPTPEVLQTLSFEDFQKLRLSKNKINTIKLVTTMFVNHEISQEVFHSFPTAAEKIKFIISIKGLGIWSANYILIRSLKQNDVILFKDVGLNNCLKTLLNLEKIEDSFLLALQNRYQQWCRYAVFYLWRVLY